MNISNLTNFISSGETSTLYTPKVLRCKISAWFSQQAFKPLALSSENSAQLRSYFSSHCTKKNEAANLVAHVANFTLFHTPKDGLNFLSLLLQKENPNLQDYKTLHETSDHLLYCVEDYLINRTLCWLQDRMIQLWSTNRFIPSGAPTYTNFRLKYDDMTENLRDPRSIILMCHIFSHLRKTGEHYMTLQERFSATDDELHAILTIKKSIQDPACDRVLEDIFNLFEIGSIDPHFNEAKAGIKTNPVHPKYGKLCSTLLPMSPKYYALMASPKAFSFHDPLDGSEAFAEMSVIYNNARENTLHIYQQILTKMSQIKDSSPLRGRPNFEALYPEPRGSYELLNEKIDLCINYHFVSSFRQQLARVTERINSEVIVPVEPILPEPTPERPALPIDPRVSRWFDPNNDPFVNDPQYIKIPARKQPKIRFIHNFAKIVDDISMEVGRSFLRANKQGVDERMISMAIQADTPFSKKTETYVSTLTFGTDNVLYHRTLTKKSQGALIDEMTAEGVYERDFPPLESMKKSVVIPQDLLNKVADDGSYILSVDGKVIKVADPKWPRADGSPTHIYIMVI